MNGRLIAGAVAVAASSVAVLTLAGCAAEPKAAPTVTTTVTATVTATPAPMTTDSPLTAEQAWLLCYGRSLSDLDPANFTILPMGSDNVTGTGGAYDVKVFFNPKGSGAGGQTECRVSGTFGAPTVDYTGPIDFG